MAESEQTIFALSSGSPPAGIAIVRISGSYAGAVLERIAGSLPSPRRASVRTLKDSDGAAIDVAMILWFPGPANATGEDLAELHLHGGRAVVSRALSVLAGISGLRHAEPGEFTRRAFLNGRIDLLEAEALGDLLAAETEWQRRSALARGNGTLSRTIEAWRTRGLAMAARVEASLDFGDEDDVIGRESDVRVGCSQLATEITACLELPSVERIRDGISVVLAGPPNSGKSSLLNRLVNRDAAIVSEQAGTTRDVVEVPAMLHGVPLLFADTAGIRDATDAVEAIGIKRAEERIRAADILLWLGDDRPPAHDRVIWLFPRSDIRSGDIDAARCPVSAVTGCGIGALLNRLRSLVISVLPPADAIAISRRQRELLGEALHCVTTAGAESDVVLQAEWLRRLRIRLDQLTGKAGFEDLMDSVFGQFCLGK